jgi:putative ABC transport system permease protein
MAMRTLIDRPGRSMLTLLGIVIGIVALVVMMSLIEALDTTVRAATQSLGTGVFQVQKEHRFGGGGRGRPDNRPAFTMADVHYLRDRLELTSEVGGEMWSWNNAFRTEKRKTEPACQLAGVTPVFLSANARELEAGRFITEQDLALRRRVAVIGSDVVDTLFPNGIAEAIGSTIRLRGKPFEIIGTIKKRPTLFGAAWQNCLAVVPIETFHREFYFQSLHVTFLAKDPTKMDEAQAEAMLVVRKLRRLEVGEKNDFEMFSNQSIGGELDSLALIIGGAAGAICLLALLAGGIGVMNIMLVSVMERTREIGIRKALGARPATILGQFIIEAVVMAGSGGLIGLLLAIAGVTIAGAALELPTQVPMFAVVLALVSSAFIGLAAGIYPAARAARLDPIEALRHE